MSIIGFTKLYSNIIKSNQPETVKRVTTSHLKLLFLLFKLNLARQPHQDTIFYDAEQTNLDPTRTINIEYDV